MVNRARFRNTLFCTTAYKLYIVGIPKQVAFAVHTSAYRNRSALLRHAAAAVVFLCFVIPVSSFGQNKSTRNLKIAHTLSLPSVAVDADQAAERPFAYVVPVERDEVVVVSLETGKRLSAWSVPTDAGRVLDVTVAHSADRDIVVALLSSGLALVDVTDEAGAHLIRTVPDGEQSEKGSVFAYRHSTGSGIVAVARGGSIRLYDLDALLTGDAIGTALSTPEQLERGTSGFDTVFIEYHLPSAQDRLYGGGAGGYHVFDITNPAAPGLLASVNPATVGRGQVAVPTPDGRYLVATAEYEWSPVQVYDLEPIFSGTTGTVRTSESAWTPNWKGFTRAIEVRWPLAFTASSGDGLQVFNLRDPVNLFTVGFVESGTSGDAGSGAFDLDFRNADGRIVVADTKSGVWVVQLDEMQFWDGHGYGMPNNSSAQDWEGGPDMIGPE